jgi:hypothetical protein
MFLRNTITAVIAIAVVGIPSSAGAAEVFGPGAAVGAWYGTAPVGSPPPTARLPYYEYGPWAAYDRPVPYPDRPYPSPAVRQSGPTLLPMGTWRAGLERPRVVSDAGANLRLKNDTEIKTTAPAV